MKKVSIINLKLTLLIFIVLLLISKNYAQNIPIVISYFPTANKDMVLCFDRTIDYKESWSNISKRYNLNEKKAKSFNAENGKNIQKKKIRIPLILNSNLFMKYVNQNGVIYVPVYYLIKTTQKANRLSLIFKEPLLTFIKNYNKIKDHYTLNRNAPIFVGYLKVSKEFGWNFANQNSKIKNYNTLEDFTISQKNIIKKPIKETKIKEVQTVKVEKKPIIVSKSNMALNKLAKVAVALPSEMPNKLNKYEYKDNKIDNNKDIIYKNPKQNYFENNKNKNIINIESNKNKNITNIENNKTIKENENINNNETSKDTEENNNDKDTTKTDEEKALELNNELETTDLNNLIENELNNEDSSKSNHKLNKPLQTTNNNLVSIKKDSPIIQKTQNINLKPSNIVSAPNNKNAVSFFKSEYDEDKEASKKQEIEFDCIMKIFKLMFDESENKFYVLFSKLPPGSVIKILNLVNNKVIYAKIITSVPSSLLKNIVNKENKDIIVLSEIGAKELDVKDNSNLKITLLK